MISIVYSTHKNEEYNSNFKQHLLQSVGLENVQILQYQNNNIILKNFEKREPITFGFTFGPK